MSAQQVLDALGDPTRRRVLELLRHGPVAVGDIADQLPVSRPAVSKHLKVLGESGLVTHVRVGTRSLYRIDARGLTALREYLDGFWTEVLDAFAEHVAEAGRPADPSRSAGDSAGDSIGRSSGADTSPATRTTETHPPTSEAPEEKHP